MQFFCKKKFLISILIIGILAGSGYVAWQNSSIRSWVTRHLPKKLDTAKLYDQALSDGLRYKSEGDAGDSKGYAKAIVEYKKAARLSNTWLAYLNAGNVYQLMRQYENAENAYKNGIKRQPTEASLYLAFAELYRYNLRKSEQEIIEVYEHGLAQIPKNQNLRGIYAGYLRDIGRKEDAIRQFDILLRQFPENSLYQEEIKRLRGRSVAY